LLKEVAYPPYLIANGITGARRGFNGPWLLAAFDTETVRGEPFKLQLAFGPEPKDVRVWDVTPDTILGIFVSALGEWVRTRRLCAVYAHNLKFDLSALLYNRRELFGTAAREFDLDCGEAVMHAYVDKLWFAKLDYGEHRMVWLVDSRAVFLGSLAKAAEMTGSPFAKLAHPEGLGRRRLHGPEFEAYIRNDVLAGYHVARAIEAMHKDYDVPFSLSAPHFASRVFKRHYLNPHNMPFPPPDIARAAELAYHGGKNQMSVPAGWYKRAWELDINSAYTNAMKNLPSFVAGEYVRVTEVPHGAHGVLCISGRRSSCPYGVVFSHSFQPLREDFNDVWVTVYEVEEALRQKELDLTRCWGWVWRAKPGAPTPLRLYAERFFKLKQLELRKAGKGSLSYYTTKLLANSLYGKFMQTVREVCEVDLDPDTGEAEIVETWRAGGMYHPFLACLITGFVRAQLHAMEHLTRSLHSSTDAVKTQINPREVREFIGEGLGKWSVEIGPSSLLLLRPKLYIHEPSAAGGKVKYALHGFHGDLKALMEAVGTRADPGPVFRGKRFKYFAQHCWTIRETLIRKADRRLPLDIEQVGYFLNAVQEPGFRAIMP